MSIHELLLNQHADKIVAHLTLHEPSDPGIAAIEEAYRLLAECGSYEGVLDSFSGGFKGVRISNLYGDTTWSLAKTLEEAIHWRRLLDEVDEELMASFMTKEQYQEQAEDNTRSRQRTLP